jgi:hypothetical protein
MDSIECIYSAYKHYENSYEIGVLHNNRAASYLTWAIHNEDTNKNQDSLVNLAESAVLKSIEIYDHWLMRFQGLDQEEIKSIISDDFLEGLERYDADKQKKYLKNRIKEIEESNIETSRRMSVAYTNLGIVFRHRLLYDSAAFSYQKAIDLWDRNLTAENNLNILLGRPLKKRSFLQKLFPPDRD